MTKAELDREVAVQVFGVSRIKLKNIPKYSSDMSRATEVFDEMRKKGHRWILIAGEEGFFLRHLLSVSHDPEKDHKNYRADRPIGMVATTPAGLAKLICEAALEEINK